MSLTIYYSDRIEDLAEKLKKELRDERGKCDPFAFSTVVVPNTNIAKWLQIGKFGDEPSLCMGIEFPFIEDCLFKLLASGIKAEKRPRLLPPNSYTVGILSILLNDSDSTLVPFRRYIAGGDGDRLSINSREKARMAWQLSVKLADLMDKYEVHRPKVVENWFNGRNAKGGPLVQGGVEAAEAALAQKLFGKDGLYPPSGDFLSLRQLFERVQDPKECRRPSGERRTIYFFGLSTLSELQAQILLWLAGSYDIVFYHNNVCMDFWGEIKTKKELLRSLPDADADIAPKDLENPLLQQWGRAGRETLRLLVDIEEQNGNSETPVDFTWEQLPSHGGDGGRMLQKVQASVRRTDAEIERVAVQDATIQIVAAPGIRREVEMVYNAILGAVLKPKDERLWGDCKFSDIAVLVPDMATYRPIIEEVFDGRGQIPYGLIDTTASEDSAYLQGFMALMALAREGLSRETLFAILDNPCAQRALAFGAEDVANWRRYAKEIGAFDGFAGDENKDFGNLSWTRALTRLRLGRVSKGGGKLVVWDGGDDDSVLRFSEIVEMLHRELSPLAGVTLRCANPQEKKDEDDGEQTWFDELRRIANEFLAVERDDKLEGPVKGQVFATLSALACIKGKQGLDLVAAAVEESVGGVKCRKGGYLTHGVTIAGLQPMRPVPFKQVFVLGMGEGMFPGRDSATTLEIAGAQRTLGDMQPVEMKRFLFLETLMAVKERLVVSYPCLDPVKDAELFPSGMVCELEKFLEDRVLPVTETASGDGKKNPVVFRKVLLPLLERGEEADFEHDDKPEKNLLEDPVAPICWKDEFHAGLIPTYSNVERRIARAVAAIQSPASADAATRRNNLEPDDRPSTPEGRVVIKTKELAEFLKSPLRAALRYRHGIGVEGYRDGSIDSEAPLELDGSGPARRDFDRALLEAASGSDDAAEPDVAEVCRSFAECGKLPDADGFFGAYVIDKEGENFEELRQLKAFVDGFFPEGVKPDLVRTLLPATVPAEEEVAAGAKPLPERLFTGQTKDWIVAEDGTSSSVLLFNKCGDVRNKETISRAPFPPKAVLEPLVAWVAMVAGAEDENERSLRVGIADAGARLSCIWTWEKKPSEAKRWLDAVSGAYLRYLDEPDEDGVYLDFGYDALAKAFKEAKKKGRIAGKIPYVDEEWEKVVDSFPDRDYHGDNGNGFDNGLVVDETVEPFRRLPGEGDDDTATKDVLAVKLRYEQWFKPVFEGVR